MKDEQIKSLNFNDDQRAYLYRNVKKNMEASRLKDELRDSPVKRKQDEKILKCRRRIEDIKEQQKLDKEFDYDDL